jgi:hypothetical protein
MTTEVHNYSDQSVTSLVRGIVNDVQDLVKQQLQLTREEIQADVKKSKEPILLFLSGAGSFLLCGITFCLALAHLLHWLTIPRGTDLSGLPLWGSYAIVCVAFLILGAILFAVGANKMKTIHPLQNPATEALKENVQWLNTPK